MKKEKGFLERIFGISTKNKKKIRNKFYLFKVERGSSISDIKGTYSNLSKAKNAAKNIARKSKYQIYIISGQNQNEASSFIYEYDQDLVGPISYAEHDRAAEHIACYYQGKQHKKYKRHIHHKHYKHRKH